MKTMATSEMMILLVMVLAWVHVADSVPLDGNLGSRMKRSVVDIENPREVIRVLNSLAQSIIDAQYESLSNSPDKRGLDMGMSRGFSGRQAAKHLVGLASAQFAGGPGKK